MFRRTFQQLSAMVANGTKKSARRARLRPGLEALEDRLALSTIVWSNRGGGARGDSDSFEQYYGADANKARAIVDAAIDAWESAIVDFNYSYLNEPGAVNAWEPLAGTNNQPNTYRVEISATDFSDVSLGGEGATNTLRGSTGITNIDHSGKPFEGRIAMDNDAASEKWYFDTTPYSSSEVTSTTPSGYRGSGDLSGKVDFYSTILHEIGHAVGVSTNEELAISRYLHDSGLGTNYTPSPGSEPIEQSDLYTFHPDKLATTPPTYTLTVGGLQKGHLYSGQDGGPGALVLPTHPDDLMDDDSRPENTRETITPTDLLLLRDAYGYAVSDPALKLAHMSSPVYADAAAGLIVVNGDFGSSKTVDDAIAIRRNGEGLLIEMNGQFSTFSRSAFANGTILVRGGLGQDTVTVDLAGGDLLPGLTFVRVEGGGEPDDPAQDDTVIVKTGSVSQVWVDGDAISVGSSLLVKHHDMEEAQVVKSSIDDKTADTVTIMSPHYTLERLWVHTGDGKDTVRVYSTGEDTVVNIHGGGNTDTVTVGNASGTLDDILGVVNVYGDNGGQDSLVVMSKRDADQTIVVNTDSVVAGNRSVSFAGVEKLTVEGGPKADTFRLTVAPAFASLTLRGNGGNADALVGLNQVNRWDVTSVNKGDLNGTVHFVGVENLTGGNQADTFAFDAAGRVDGTVDGKGGANELSYATLPVSAPVTVDLQAGTATGLGGFRNIETVVGGNGTDTLKGAERTNSTYAITGPNAGKQAWSYTLGTVTISGSVGFRSFESLVGTALPEVFSLAGGNLTGSIDGGGGEDTLSYAVWRLGVTVNLTLGTATNVSAGVSAIENATGGLGNDLLMGNDAVNVLLGGGGGDVLIGGAGADELRGGGGDDLLIGGGVNFGADLRAALEAIRANWTATRLTFDQRVAAVTGKASASEPYKLNSKTLAADDSEDILEGGLGRDLFFAELAREMVDWTKEDRWVRA